MASEDHGLRAIIYDRDGASGRATLKLLDQRVIPYEKTYLDVRDSKGRLGVEIDLKRLFVRELKVCICVCVCVCASLVCFVL